MQAWLPSGPDIHVLSDWYVLIHGKDVKIKWGFPIDQFSGVSQGKNIIVYGIATPGKTQFGRGAT